MFPLDIKRNDPTVSYSINNPIRYKIFNFNKFIHILDDEAFFISILPCYCEGSKFVDKDHHSIVSGYLQIIKSNILRTKDPKYRTKVTFHGKWLKQASWSFHPIFYGLFMCVWFMGGLHPSKVRVWTRSARNLKVLQEVHSSYLFSKNP